MWAVFVLDRECVRKVGLLPLCCNCVAFVPPNARS